MSPGESQRSEDLEEHRIQQRSWSEGEIKEGEHGTKNQIKKLFK